MQRLLDSVEFRYPERAREHIRRLGDGIPERIAARIQSMLAGAPDPDEALHYLQRLREQSAAVFERIASSPSSLRYLITTFSYSHFLSEAVLRNPEWLVQISASGDMYRVLTEEEYAEQLDTFLGPESPGVPPAGMLARFRRRQLLRIMLRDVLGMASLSDVTEEISNLADAILDTTYRRIRADLVSKHGEPQRDGHACGFAVIGLGKLGGRELNYSSDIDLMFVYGGNGDTAEPDTITNKEFFKKIANRCTDLLSTHTADGICYRVDLRLRPEGRYGEVCISLDGARSYYRDRARDWEKQMLIKARVSACDRAVGRDLLDFVAPMIYSSTTDFHAVEAVSETRERIGEKLGARRGSKGIDVKLAPGGIRDIEFLVQCLQRLHGGRDPWVRHGGTLVALARLHDKNLLSGVEYARLFGAYGFLRTLEHRLQFDEDRQTHSMPAAPDALDILARKMPAGPDGEKLTAATLQERLEHHLAGVRELYERVIHANKPIYYTAADSGAPAEPDAPEPGAAAPANLARFLDLRAPNLAATLARVRVSRGRQRLDHFLETALARPDLLARLERDPALVERIADLFEHSRYFADELLRYPELLEEPAQEDEPLDDAAALRRYFRAKVFQIETASIAGAPIFHTLEQTSSLADRVIAAAYYIALYQAPRPHTPGYIPSDQMMVIALGRLGMGEFDLGSDADLIFVIPDADKAELVFWTGVAERTIQTLSAYTGEGVMFTVDNRLRPNGREGGLVQTEAAYRTYFAKGAEAWEGIAYMKSRAVAGNIERATEFLNQLQEVDWRRYGQSGRSRTQLAEMRARLEKEQGARNPLKAGPGGFYDIDFALMYLRLKGAGIFYKVLNTPARIDVVEKMGHLGPRGRRFPPRCGHLLPCH